MRQGSKSLGLIVRNVLLLLLAALCPARATDQSKPVVAIEPPLATELVPTRITSEEPIAYVGHGAFFARDGRQIVPTAEFVARAQRWYRDQLIATLDEKTRAELTTLEKRLVTGLAAEGQTRLQVTQRSLDWLLARAPQTKVTGRWRAKLAALASRLEWQLPAGDELEELRSLTPFELPQEIGKRLERPEFRLGSRAVALVTTNKGQAYLDECAASGVPIPPPIGVLDPNGTAGWRSLGFIPPTEQFIVGTPAEVRAFVAPTGMCIALPRYTNASLTNVSLDGVICLSSTTSKVCFWDNSMNNGPNFTFASGDRIPIGVPNLAIDPLGRYQAGGAEIEFAGGGECTDCHAGENPYIIHPNSNLGGVFMGDLNSPPLNLPTFGPDRYDPIVGATWAQNQLSHSEPLVPRACSTCHTLGGSGGRFPHLSNELPGYCGTVLANAINRTMPLGAPGSQAGTPAMNTFRNWCNSAPSAGPSDRGDPHLETTNRIRYDFQAAGEFVALRNSATGFELQVRQTPVLTSFTPGPDAHTGLSSCVSINTAAALRVGRHRISYHPRFVGRGERMELTIDGRVVELPPHSLDLGEGNRIGRAAAGEGIDVVVADGTRVIVTPGFWESEGYWYLNLEVLGSPAREGILGPIQGDDWLPLAPNGASFGARPASLMTRHLMLNRSFADAWRVTEKSSLFEYEPGTSTATFTERSWPPASGASCLAIRSNPWLGGKPRRPVDPMAAEEALKHCQGIEDREVFGHCVFDTTATGNPGVAAAYHLSLRLRNSPPPGVTPP
jgi:hypothetical protein